MPSWPVNFGRVTYRTGVRTSKEGETPCCSSQRPTMYSTNDVERMAIERARMNSGFDQCSRDFTAYFLSSEKTVDPLCASTSHSSKDPVVCQKRSAAFPVQCIRWNPYVETSSIEDIDNEEEPLYECAKCGYCPIKRCTSKHNRDENNRVKTKNKCMCEDCVIQKCPSKVMKSEDTKYKCKCGNCAMKKCPSVLSASNTVKRAGFKDNIMTFNDQGTMTPQLIDTGCGCIPCMKASALTVKHLDIPVRGSKAKMYVPKLCDPNRRHPSILKNKPPRKDNIYQVNSDCSGVCCVNVEEVPEFPCQRTAKDSDEDEDNKSDARSIRSVEIEIDNVLKDGCERRILYNEGISDSVTMKYPIVPIRVPSPTNQANGRSRVYASLEKSIPHSHKGESKYHHSCSRSQHMINIRGDPIRHMVACPQLVKKKNKLIMSQKVPSIRLPKKVLTSERNIESFINRECPQVPCTKKPLSPTCFDSTG